MQFESAAADMIASRAQLLAAHAIDLGHDSWSVDEPQLGERAQQLDEATMHLRSLSDAMLGASEQLFVDYVDWARTRMAARRQSVSQLTGQLDALRAVLEHDLPQAAPAAATFLSAALSRLAAPAVESHSEVRADSLAARYLERLLAFDRNGAVALVRRAIDAGTALPEIYLEVIQRAQHEIGRLWQLNRITIAHEHYCTAVSQLVLAQLYPLLMRGPGGEPMVATCVADELHELGARMVADFFEMDGWDTTYIGANAPAKDLLQMLRKRRAGLLAISATMGCHVHTALALIERVRDAPDLRHVKILVGGRPFSVAGSLWQQLGADGCAGDAREAIAVGRNLLGLPPGEAQQALTSREPHSA